MIAFADLAEAEGRAFRRAVVRTTWALALLTVVALFIVLAIALWLWAFYLFLNTFLPAALAAVLTGAASIIVAGVCAWFVRRLIR